MTVLRTTALALGVLALTSTTAGNAAAASPLDVPAGNQVLTSLRGTGVQVYRCTSGAWTFVEPAAILTDRGRTVGLHSRGPRWASLRDGSTVSATAVANVPRTGAVPELLLKATGTEGGGVFGRVTFVQRLATRGGLAPTGACAEGASTAVPYVADYVFYGA
ncbi:DUF3455 domain-containing protein [Umezawaea beigongshangensis]|uniref:DUF3455 domain-containing protein n=1 Tax=Umezawaea beigongshangensis TaxID=2780383 RepID=UPI0018F233A8|nr:DUF3455 domain-containing protein [Umezawaea beigongshangensis]